VIPAGGVFLSFFIRILHLPLSLVTLIVQLPLSPEKYAVIADFLIALHRREKMTASASIPVFAAISFIINGFAEITNYWYYKNMNLKSRFAAWQLYRKERRRYH